MEEVPEVQRQWEAQRTAPQKLGRREFAVIGHPRSGTGYMALLFQSFGFDVGHERIADHGVSAWQFAVPDLSTQWLKHPRNRWDFRHVIHVVRNPADVVNSSAQRDHAGIGVITRALGIDHGKCSMYEKAARNWIEWNRICADQADVIIPVESADEALAAWLKDEGYPVSENEKPPKNYNTRHPNPQNWEFLRDAVGELAGPLIEEGRRYGYEIDR